MRKKGFSYAQLCIFKSTHDRIRLMASLKSINLAGDKVTMCNLIDSLVDAEWHRMGMNEKSQRLIAGGMPGSAISSERQQELEKLQGTNGEVGGVQKV